METSQPLKQSLIVGVFFLILFTANSSFSLIITQLHEQDGNRQMGPFLLILYYSSYMLSNIVSPSINWKYKTQMTLAPILYGINFSTGILIPYTDSVTLKYFISGCGGLIGGFGAALLWTSIGGYMHLLCKKYQVEHSKGYYFGIFSAIYCTQSISGALTTTFGLGYFEVATYFMLVTSIAILSSIFCKIMVNDLQSTSQSVLEVHQSDQLFSLRKALKRISDFYPKMTHLLPLIFLNGIVIGFVNSSITHLIPPSATDQQANVKAGICFILYGFGSVLGGYVSSAFTDCYSMKRTGKMNIYLFVVTCTTSYLSVGSNSYTFICVVFFLWGLLLYYIQGWIMVVCSKIYGGKLESFAISKQFHSFSFVLYELFTMLTENKIGLNMIIPFFSVLLIPTVIGLDMLVKKYDQNVSFFLNEEPVKLNKGSVQPTQNLQALKLIDNQER